MFPRSAIFSREGKRNQKQRQMSNLIGYWRVSRRFEAPLSRNSPLNGALYSAESEQVTHLALFLIGRAGRRRACGREQIELQEKL